MCGLQYIGETKQQLSKLSKRLNGHRSDGNCKSDYDVIDLVQAFLKKWWVESDFKAPNLPLGAMVNYSDLQFPERIMVVRRSEMSA
jgi:hypothetical protein